MMTDEEYASDEDYAQEEAWEEQWEMRRPYSRCTDRDAALHWECEAYRVMKSIRNSLSTFTSVRQTADMVDAFVSEMTGIPIYELNDMDGKMLDFRDTYVVLVEHNIDPQEVMTALKLRFG